MTNHTAETLRGFENDIAEEFNAGKIRAPIHLDGGNEEVLLKIFKDVDPKDWVCCSWRSHYKALLHGIPPDQVKAAIMAGHSITLCFPEYRFISSAIVGGVLPIALGIAWSIKRAGSADRVWAFVGDMTSRTGIFHEVATYAAGHELPLLIVIEDNGKSVCTDTREAWGRQRRWGASLTHWNYGYELPWPHSGAGKRVEF